MSGSAKDPGSAGAPPPPRKARVLRFAFVLAALLGAKAFVLDAYGVRERSMWPTLKDREHVVLVDKTAVARGALRRFDLVVATKDGHAIVKRAASLGGESVRIAGGDLFVRGADGVATRPARSAETAAEMRVPVYPPPGERGATTRPTLRVAGDGAAEARPNGVVTLEPKGGSLRAFVQSPSGGDALKDDHPGADGRLVRGRHDVGDIFMEIGAIGRGAGATFVVAHRIGGDVRRVRIGDGGAFYDAEEEGRPARGAAFAPGAEIDSLRMVTLDGAFSVEVRRGARAGAAAPNWERWIDEPRPTENLRGPSTVRFDAEGGPVLLMALVVARDAHYVRAGDSPRDDLWFSVPPGEAFLLGDNAPVSTDSRTFGTATPAETIGRVVGVFRRPEWAR